MIMCNKSVQYNPCSMMAEIPLWSSDRVPQSYRAGLFECNILRFFNGTNQTALRCNKMFVYVASV